ncbi:hypothetical protein [Chromobacterium amazonense]|uniref:NERD domain-containing protein n=1 Tax=Chromobacterium amazonense TaxID=1382803 RepID=A0ABU8UZL8_9NEIS|nr:hypothetical protein [Chromobacterium amazonense]MDQ4540350.1 hypothetical protein [Chromobacterium amazonense]
MNEKILIDIKEIEEIIDNQLYKIETPHIIKNIAIWHLLTVSEDAARMLFIKHIEMTAQEINIFIDESKYALRHCLNHIIKNSKNYQFPPPNKTIPKSYSQATELFYASLNYEKHCRVIASYYNNRSLIEKANNVYHFKHIDSIDARYSALEGFKHGAEQNLDITSLLYHWLNDSQFSSIMSSKFIKHARLRKGQVLYNYDPETILYLTQFIPQRKKIIPDGFVFSWGNSEQTHALINSLLIRCLYHILTISYFSDEKKIPGGAESSLVLKIEKEQLCKEISYLADFNDGNIVSFIEFISYGYKTKTPDPALQPLIKLEKDIYLIPCIHVLTNNLQRNLLALMARMAPNEFDRQSNLFENEMIKKLSPILQGWPLKYFSREYSINSQKEEIDVLLLDPKEKIILLFELRWMNQPGDAREVFNRIKVCNEKVSQLERKIDFVSNFKEEIILRTFPTTNYNDDADEYSVNGAVVIQGFGGHASNKDCIPIITLEALEIGTKNITSLTKLYDWIKSLTWLPQENKDFKETIEELAIGDSFLHRPALEILVEQDEYVAHAISSTKPFI